MTATVVVTLRFPKRRQREFRLGEARSSDRPNATSSGSSVSGHQRRSSDSSLIAPPGAVEAISDESLDLRWWPLTELPDEVAFGRSLVGAAPGRRRS